MRLLWLFVVLTLGVAGAVPPRPNVLRVLFENPRAGSIGRAADAMADAVRQESGGRLLLDVHGDGTWFSHQHLAELKILHLVHDGDCDIGIVTNTPLANYVPDYELLDTPFLFDTYAQCDAALDGPAGQSLADELPAHGLMGLAYWDTGFRVLALRHPWRGLDAFRGCTVRVMQATSYQLAMRLFGAVPVPTAIDQVPPMLAAGRLDAVDTCYPPFLERHLNEQLKFIVESRHAYACKMVVMNLARFNSLTPQEQQWLMAAAMRTRLLERHLFRAEEAAVRARCRALGVSLVPLSTSDARRMRADCRPLYQTLLQRFHDPRQQALLQAALQRSR
ncbi:MAG: TRAP transporter substrate-binding protein [Candidatus Xenobia bacterium]